MPILKPGVYDIPADEYHADPCPEPSLSSSIAKLLVTPGASPMHAKWDCPRLNPEYEPEERAMFDLGAAAHSLLLNDERAFEIVDAADWRSKEAKNLRDEARALGKIPILVGQWERTIEMVRAARVQLDAHADGPFFVGGKAEETMVWMEGAVWCRARLDYRIPGARVFPDYKSTAASADPDCWVRTMYGMNADLQAAFYLRGIKALGLCESPQFRFVVQENYAPFALSVIGLMPGALDLADRQVEHAIHLWGECLKSGRWRGYPTRTCWVDAPAWHEASLMARETRENDAELLQQAREAQRP